MDHELTPAGQAVFDHLTTRFDGGPPVVSPPAPGPARALVPDLHIVRLTPPGPGWVYATTGLWEATQRDGHGLEFVLHAPRVDDVTHIETLSMVGYYHASGGDYTLGLGHTVPIGRPWQPGSACDHLLVSLPYPWGPEFERCEVPGGHAQLLWLLPITAAEKRYRHEHGLEALEQLFEEAEIIPNDPLRDCVVASRGKR
ncbi:hypothetical protein Ait01nite_040510 [Actinoplanes italicus]|uniref:Suppressor of fused protein SUFU n=1 Tax=Actinoplanes italicus TaxID=113567 RepID=A0A2T0K236_9ACTN|nr:suppressor of fused domain protein [Actinoplanes italicus]PRX16862.1 suppressor of fused protein SUFU [Actinoplanes italicus]GIE31006.1 hypothetical protein Ait01nite_040510 [Actinoplanes italicus]